MFSISNVIDCLDSSRLLITVLFICSSLYGMRYKCTGVTAGARKDDLSFENKII